MLTPSQDDFRAETAAGRTVPLRRRIPADLETPVSAFLKLQSNLPGGRRARFLLESVEQGIQVGRYSFIGVSPSATLRLVDDTVTVERSDGTQTFPVGDGDPLSIVRDEIARTPAISGYDLPGPFAGAVGYISYDIARYFERLPRPEGDGLGLPDYCFMIPQSLVVFDHVRSEIEIVVLPPGGDADRAWETALRESDELLDALASPLDLRNGDHPEALAEKPQSNVSRERYKEMVRDAREHILAGDALQVVPSQRFGARTSTDPFQIYRALRILNPSPYMFFIDFDGFELIGSSPEVLVKLEGRRATLAPIAGTRPRGESSAEDEALATELLTDEKERAEHVMLVDLGRNDLGRVCEIGSVQVESLMHIERYSHVMHIVSSVSGTLSDGVDGFDLLRACFPAGTVSGAPKIRAMEIIAGLEGERRGPYAGAVGYFGHGGNMDMCIAIRTIVMIGDRFYVQAGGGVVADSDAAAEYEETVNKASALMRAVTVAEEGL